MTRAVKAATPGAVLVATDARQPPRHSSHEGGILDLEQQDAAEDGRAPDDLRWLHSFAEPHPGD